MLVVINSKYCWFGITFDQSYTSNTHLLRFNLKRIHFEKRLIKMDSLSTNQSSVFKKSLIIFCFLPEVSRLLPIQTIIHLIFYIWNQWFFVFIIISAKSSPSLFPLLTHRSAYPNSGFPA